MQHAWAREKERSIDRAELPTDIKELKRLTVADLLKRYEQEITPSKQGAVFERSRIRQLLAHRMSQTSLSNLSGATVTQHRDDRLRVVKPPSVRRELVVLCHVFEVARREWCLPIRENPVKRIGFTSERAGPFTTAGFARMMERAGVEAGMPFKVHPHMLRHACGFALANKGHDTRALQAYLGHRNIQHTVRYTELSPTRFKDFWRS